MGDLDKRVEEIRNDNHGGCHFPDECPGGAYEQVADLCDGCQINILLAAYDDMKAVVDDWREGYKDAKKWDDLGVSEIRETVESISAQDAPWEFWVKATHEMLDAYDAMKKERDEALSQVKKDHGRCQDDAYSPCKFCYESGLAR